jgi:hypothetical protein
MGKCVFQTSDLLRLARHARAAEQHEMGFGEGPSMPGLLFVHDQGVYLMSNGIPRDTEGVASGSHVVYAEGCNPNVGDFDDWYDTSRDLVGGDDFVEVLRLGQTPEEQQLFIDNCGQFKEFVVSISPTSLTAGFRKPIRRKATTRRA